MWFTVNNFICRSMVPVSWLLSPQTWSCQLYQVNVCCHGDRSGTGSCFGRERQADRQFSSMCTCREDAQCAMATEMISPFLSPPSCLHQRVSLPYTAWPHGLKQKRENWTWFWLDIRNSRENLIVTCKCNKCKYHLPSGVGLFLSKILSLFLVSTSSWGTYLALKPLNAASVQQLFDVCVYVLVMWSIAHCSTVLLMQ